MLKAAEINSTDMHTVSISCSSAIDSESLQANIQEGFKTYAKSHTHCRLTSSCVTLGGIHPMKNGVYLFAYIRDVVFFNLLVGKSEDGVDLFEYVYEDSAGTRMDVTRHPMNELEKSFPETLSQFDISFQDMAQGSIKMKQALDQVRSLNTTVRYDLKQRKCWLPPLISVSIRNVPCKIVPAKFNKQYHSSIQQRILTVSLLKNDITLPILEKLLDRVTARSYGETFYLKNKDIKGNSPLTMVKTNHYDIHFKSDKQTKLAFLMLKDFEYLTSKGCVSRLNCEFKQVDSSEFEDVSNRHRGRGRDRGRGRGQGRVTGGRGSGSKDPTHRW